MSFLTQSHQVFFGRPLCLIPSTSHVIQRLTQSLSSFCSTCPNHLNLFFLITKLTGSNPKSTAMKHSPKCIISVYTTCAAKICAAATAQHQVSYCYLCNCRLYTFSVESGSDTFQSTNVDVIFNYHTRHKSTSRKEGIHVKRPSVKHYALTHCPWPHTYV